MNEKKDPRFVIVGPGYKKQEEAPEVKKKRKSGRPIASMIILAVIVLGCVFCRFVMTADPTYLDLSNYNHAPSLQFLFGTDSLGRDLFSMIWYGGRSSLLIGFLATLISTVIAVIYGTISGMCKGIADDILMRITEIFLSIPSILLIIFVQAMIGKQSVWAISVVIGVTSWMSVAKMVRVEVKKLKNADYVRISRAMGGGFFHILRVHLLPNFISSIMFMVVMNIRAAIISESTLSFMGLGLPEDVLSWGSILSLSEQALMTRSWWVIVIPGVFLVVTLMCITNIGNYIRERVNRSGSLL